MISRDLALRAAELLDWHAAQMRQNHCADAKCSQWEPGSMRQQKRHDEHVALAGELRREAGA
jgi:hypothetical protein